MGKIGAEAISDLVVTKKLETLYLAGNGLCAESIRTLCQGLKRGGGGVKELWLKRSPVHAEGAAHLGKLNLSRISQIHVAFFIVLKVLGLWDATTFYQLSDVWL